MTPDERVDPPLAGEEWPLLRGYLDFHRATLEMKCSGLDAAQLAEAPGPGDMTLGGLLKHLAYVEDDWAHRWLQDLPVPEPWASAPWDEDPDWEWHSAAGEDPGALLGLWRACVERSRSALEAAVAAAGLDAPLAREFKGEGTASVRWLAIHLIEEYARHNGHADLMREAIDGSVGE